MGDVSADLLSHTGQFEGVSESFQLDRSMQEEHVPLADPGMEKPAVSGFSSLCHCLPYIDG
jgi:hypothetical protein